MACVSKNVCKCVKNKLVCRFVSMDEDMSVEMGVNLREDARTCAKV